MTNKTDKTMKKEQSQEPKYRFKNIGPIKNADLELGDLTVIAGANNAGKTYLVYTLYGFLEYISELVNMEDIFLKNELEFRRKIRMLSRLMGEDTLMLRRRREIQSRASAELVINIKVLNNGIEASMKVPEVQEYIKDRMEYLCRRFSRQIEDVFSVSGDTFEKSFLRCILPFPTSNSKKIMKDKYGPLEMEISGDVFYIKISGGFMPESEKLHAVAIKSLIMGMVIGRNFPMPFVVSAERFGISLFYKELDFTKSRVVEILQRLHDEKYSNEQSSFLISSSTARYAKPIKDNIDYTRDLEAVQKKKSKLSDYKFFEDVKNMMGGYYRYENNDIYFISKQRGEKAFKIPLHLASSSVRGMSDFYFYLKHIAHKGQLLIIDEPETHLDTKNQILMARLLARCVNAGMRILITTHSDYIIKEFNNLVMLSKKFPQKDKFLEKHKKKYTKNDFLKQESVRAYICEDGELTSCKVNNRGMYMPLFDNTIMEIDRVSDFLDSYLPEEE